jgi:hypothetical protein
MDDRDTWLDPVLTEYESMRTESVTSMQTQQSTLAFGTATVGFVAASAFGMIGESTAFAPIFVVGIPLLSLLVVVVWFGELARMMRVGHRLETLEGVVHEELVRRGAPVSVFTWEKHLREAKGRLDGQFCFSYYAVLALFAGIASTSIVFGLAQSGWSRQWMVVSVTGLVLVAVGLAVLLVGIHKAAAMSASRVADGRQWRDEFSGLMIRLLRHQPAQ